MSEEIIYTKDYALIVSDEIITVGDFYYEGCDVMHCEYKEEANDLQDACKKIIAHRPLTDAPILEGVPLLPEFVESDNVEKLACDWFVTADKKNTIFDLGWINIFYAGYNKAKETHIEILKSIESLCDNQNPTHEAIWRLCHSVQQLKRPKYFETVCDCQECGANKTNLSLDMGCENKIATITNSKGQTELVGEYSYE